MAGQPLNAVVPRQAPLSDNTRVNDETGTKVVDPSGGISQRLDTLARDLKETSQFLKRVSAPPVVASDTLGRERWGFDPGNVERLYTRRFSAPELAKKTIIWSHLTPFFSRRFPKPTNRVLDLAAGRGEFIHQFASASASVTRWPRCMV